MIENNLEKRAEGEFKRAVKDGRDEYRDIQYKDIHLLDEQTKKQHCCHMQAAHHKFMAKHYKRKMYKK